MTQLCDRYQSFRQHFINPQYIGFSTAPEVTREDILNPGSLLTSALLEQRNILRYEGCRPVRASYYLRSKSGTAMSTLLAKLFNEDMVQSYYASMSESDLYNIGIISIPNFDTTINLSDYQMLIFDRKIDEETGKVAIESGFRINDFKNSSWHVINNTLYITLMNCNKYVYDQVQENNFADTVDVVFLRKVNVTDPVRIGLMAFADGAYPTWQVTENQEPMSTLPSELVLYYENINSKTTKFTKYDSSFYGLALYLSDIQITVGDIFYDEHERPVEITDTNIAAIQAAIEQTAIKNWLLIDPSKYEIHQTGQNALLATWKPRVSSVSDLGLFIYAAYDSEDPDDIDLPRIRLPIVRLAHNSKFYIYNKATFMKTEYEYRYDENATTPFITLSRDSTVSLDALHKSFNIDKDPDTGRMLGQYPNYIPLNWKDPNYITDSEDEEGHTSDSDGHIYSRWVDTEDVFVFIDGVKLTPYQDYIVTNTGIIGEDIPAGSIKFINRVSPDIAITYPVGKPEDNKPSMHNILAFTIPSSRYRNTYYGPYVDIRNYPYTVHDQYKEDEEKYTDAGNNYYPYMVVSKNSSKVPASMLTRDNCIVFASGRYQRLGSQKDSVVMDNGIMIPELTTYNSVEYHSYFDDNEVSGVNQMEQGFSNYYPLIETVIKYLGHIPDIEDIPESLMKRYIDNFVAEHNLSRINDQSSSDYKLPTDFIYSEGANIFELWLRHNTKLVFKNDKDADNSSVTGSETSSRRRVPDRQTYFSANEDLGLKGYKNNIRVSGNDMQGMPEYTASNDVNNLEDDDDESLER